MAGSLQLDSPLVYRVNTYIPSYSTTTTDHFPVLGRFSWGAPAQLVLNEAFVRDDMLREVLHA